MRNKRNQTIAVARFLLYKADVNRRLEGMSDEDYLKKPVGLEVGEYVEDLLKYCPEETVDRVLRNQNGLISRLGEEYLSILAQMPYDKGGVSIA